MISIGFTGTRKTPTDDMRNWIHRLLVSYSRNNPEIHVGACVGADEEAHQIAHALGYTVVVHPPIDLTVASKWSVANASTLLPAQPYLERNRAIVDASNMLLAVPNGPEIMRSGTWATIRYARTKRVPRIVYPSTEAETIA